LGTHGVIKIWTRSGREEKKKVGKKRITIREPPLLKKASVPGVIQKQLIRPKAYDGYKQRKRRLMGRGV